MNPDTSQDDGTGLFCFLNQNMPCSPTCMAFTIVQPAGDEYKNQQWSRCMLLVNAHRVGKHSVIIANVLDSVTKVVKGLRADTLRVHQPPPPKVL